MFETLIELSSTTLQVRCDNYNELLQSDHRGDGGDNNDSSGGGSDSISNEPPGQQNNTIAGGGGSIVNSKVLAYNSDIQSQVKKNDESGKNNFNGYIKIQFNPYNKININ